MSTILLIEDDPLSANLVQRILHRAGHDVIHTDRGYTGVDMVFQHDVDLVLLDLGLPDVDGQMVAALISRLPRPIPIVAVTGRTGDEARDRTLSMGCDGYITKPIDTRTFVDELTPYLGVGVH